MTRKIRFRPTLAALAVLALVVAGVGWIFAVRPGLDAYNAHRYPDVPAAEAGQAQLTAVWYGTTAILLRDAEHAIMIDPFFTRPPGLLNMLTNRAIAPDEALIRRWLQEANIAHLDAVLVSHSHYDHVMDAGVVARLTGAPLLGSASTANVGRGAGLPETQIRVIKPGEAMPVGSFTVTFLESRHAGASGGRPTGDITAPLAPPAHYLDYRQGGTFSILIEHGAGNVLHHGSAGFLPGMLKGRKADVVFLGIAIRPELDGYLRETVDAVGATRVIPTHWDDFTRPLDEPLAPLPFGIDLDGFFDEMARLRPQLKVQTLDAGRTAVLFPPPAG